MSQPVAQTARGPYRPLYLGYLLKSNARSCDAEVLARGLCNRLVYAPSGILTHVSLGLASDYRGTFFVILTGNQITEYERLTSVCAC